MLQKIYGNIMRENVGIVISLQQCNRILFHPLWLKLFGAAHFWVYAYLILNICTCSIYPFYSSGKKVTETLSKWCILSSGVIIRERNTHWMTRGSNELLVACRFRLEFCTCLYFSVFSVANKRQQCNMKHTWTLWVSFTHTRLYVALLIRTNQCYFLFTSKW